MKQVLNLLRFIKNIGTQLMFLFGGSFEIYDDILGGINSLLQDLLCIRIPFLVDSLLRLYSCIKQNTIHCDKHKTTPYNYL